MVVKICETHVDVQANDFNDSSVLPFMLFEGMAKKLRPLQISSDLNKAANCSAAYRMHHCAFPREGLAARKL